MVLVLSCFSYYFNYFYLKVLTYLHPGIQKGYHIWIQVQSVFSERLESILWWRTVRNRALPYLAAHTWMVSTFYAKCALCPTKLYWTQYIAQFSSIAQLAFGVICTGTMIPNFFWSVLVFSSSYSARSDTSVIIYWSRPRTATNL